jgi:hypothetical protein
MKRAGTLLSIATVVLFGGLSVQAHAEAARGRDLRGLQAELTRLDDSLDALQPSDPRHDEFEKRAADIREDVVWLEGQVRRHREDPSKGTGATTEKVQEVQRAAVALRQDIDAAQGARAARRAGDIEQIPAGTEFDVTLDQALSSRTANVEDRVEASTLEPIMIDGQQVVPAGALVSGVVRDVQSADRVQKDGRLALDFRSLNMDSGRTSIRASTVSVSEEHSGGSSLKKGGLGAVLGGVVGGIIDGKKGAIIGAAVGAGGTLAATKGENVELPEGTVIRLRLDEPVRINR